MKSKPHQIAHAIHHMHLRVHEIVPKIDHALLRWSNSEHEHGTSLLPSHALNTDDKVLISKVSNVLISQQLERET